MADVNQNLIFRSQNRTSNTTAFILQYVTILPNSEYDALAKVIQQHPDREDTMA